MSQSSVVYLSGYRGQELGIFSVKDKRVHVIKTAIRRRLVGLIEEGVEWVLIGGNLGVELWGAEVVVALKETYEELKLGIIFPFDGFGDNWNESNRFLLQQMIQKADFVTATSSQPYTEPKQLKAHTQFMLKKSQVALLVYDDELEGKCKWLKQAISKEQEEREYQLIQIDRYELEDTSYEEFYK